MATGVYIRTKPGYWAGKKRPDISAMRKGIKLSEEHKAKLSQAKLDNPVRYWKGKSRPEASIWFKKANIGRISPLRGRHRPDLTGPNSATWKGGISRIYKTGYNSHDYKKWRKSVFERDEYTCQDCGQISGYLTAHHIKSFAHFPDLRFELDNGLTLCEPCHAKTDNYKGRGRLLASTH